jgi:nickel-dependent lactate racemase
VIGKGSTTTTITEHDARALLAQGLERVALDGKRVLVIIPDNTRTAPVPMLFRLLYEQLGARVAQLDYLIALGTHPPMTDDAIAKLVGVTKEECAVKYPKTHVFNHHWDEPRALTTLGTITRAELDVLTGGLLAQDVPVRLNKLVLEYDHIIIVGPVFPHEVVGFSGGAKYLFPGIAGAEIIDFTHWLAALVTNRKTIGVKETAVRRVIHRAAEFVPKPMTCIAFVMRGQALHGLYIGSHVEAWSAAADLSAQLNIVWVDKPFKRVLSIPAPMYDELWTAGKAMYKTEPAIADGGEVIIYAPNLKTISVTHGHWIERVGYHPLEYFTKQPDKFTDVPGSIKAHSTHVKGTGTFDPKTGIEIPRIQVTLATSIPEEVCKRINLGYADYRTINPQEWENREAEGILVVHHAGEMLYRVKSEV